MTGGRGAVRGLAAAAATLLLLDVLLLTQQHKTTEVTLDQALREFRATAQPQASSATPNAPVPVAAASPAAPVQVHAAPVASLRPAVKATGAANIPSGAPVAATGYKPPPEGVYAYRTTGGESINVAGASHTYPERTFATVRHSGGCGWEMRNDVIKEHVDIRKICSNPGQLLQLAQGREVEFFGKRDGGEFRCDPAQVVHAIAAATGTTNIAVCADTDGSKATIHGTYVGLNPVAIGGVTVAAVRVRLVSKLEGRATGTAEDELWVTPDTGMVLRWERSVDTLADAAFGAQVRYKEQATFLLESLAPQT